MKTKPLISIITVVYNGAATLEQTILSVVNQSYTNIEYIIIDGGSTDETINIIKKYEQKISCWISEPDEGIYDAMNKAIKLAKGDWVYFLSCDDILINILHRIYVLFCDKSTIYYGNVYMTEKCCIYDGKFNAFKLTDFNICHQAIFYPRWIFEKYRYNLNYPLLSDWDFNIRCWGDSHISFKYIPVIIAVYSDKGITSNRVDYKFIRDRLLIIKHNLPKIIYYHSLIKSKIYFIKRKFTKNKSNATNT